MSAWTVYWLFQLDSLNCFFSILAWLALAGIIIFIILCGIVKSTGDKPVATLYSLKLMVPIFVVSGLISTFIPTTKTMAAIIVLPRIVSAENLDTVSNDAGDIYKLAMSRLKEALGEVK